MSIINNKQNLESYVLLQTVLLYSTGTATQEGIVEEELDLRDFSLFLQDTGSVLTDELGGPAVLTIPIIKGFNW